MTDVNPRGGGKPAVWWNAAVRPAGLLNELEQAFNRIDIGAVSRAIENICAQHPSIADALAAVARDLQFGRILPMIRAARAGITPEDET